MNKIKLISIVIVMVCIFLVGCKNKESCNHIYDNGIVKTEATCVAEGEMVYICTLCNEAKYESIPTTDHNYLENIEKEPTETEVGEKKLVCQICEDSYTESIPKIVVERKLGDKEMPYSFDDDIYLEYMNDIWDTYSGGATIKLSNYNTDNYSFEVDLKLEDTGEQGSFEPFGDCAIIIRYINEEYREIGYTADTTDPNYMDLLYHKSLSLHAGGEGNTHIFSYDIEESGEEPKYITLYICNGIDKERWIWVKLPQ